MNYIIRNIDSLNIEDKSIWGSKISYISDAKSHGFNIMDGFCISFKDGIFDENSPNFLKEVQEYFEKLHTRTKATSYIVRSSAQLEDNVLNTFPGIYKSIGNISNFQDLVDAIKCCYNSQKSLPVQYYIKNMKMDCNPNTNFSILVQEELEPEYSGVAFSKVPINYYYNSNCYLVEMVKGHCKKMISGHEKSYSYLIDKNNKSYKIESLHCSYNPAQNKTSEILCKLAKQIENLTSIYGEYLNIEWGYKNNQIVIFQIRPFLHRANDSKSAISSDRGFKADAMAKFKDLELFTKNLIIIDKGENLKNIEQILDNAPFEKEITIRYSCKNEIGLPRYFASNKREALKFLKDTYHNDWTIILHESVDVMHSFELYLDDEKAILEHMPGMWESDNKNSTDIWIIENSHVISYFVDSFRTAKYENKNGEYYKIFKPFKTSEIERIGKRILDYINILKENWQTKDGINFHFVLDEKGEIYFLNQRETTKLINCYEMLESPIEVKTYNDLLTCSGNNILLKIDLKRGEEILLKDFIPLLKEKKVKVFVEFGILSHPAILLREMGIDVYPYYTIHKKHVFTI